VGGVGGWMAIGATFAALVVALRSTRLHDPATAA